jgi:hypothetical protein
MDPTPEPDPAETSAEDLANQQPRSAGPGAAVVGAGIGLLAVGWFLLSHFVMDTEVADAIQEAVGVAFGLLILVSIIGAVRSTRGNPG